MCGKRRLKPAVVDPAPGGRILLSERQGRLLEALVRRSSAPQRLVKRAQIILYNVILLVPLLRNSYTLLVVAQTNTLR